jgi:hypothetical protein
VWVPAGTTPGTRNLAIEPAAPGGNGASKKGRGAVDKHVRKQLTELYAPRTRDYAVGPLEGLCTADDPAAFTG